MLAKIKQQFVEGKTLLQFGFLKCFGQGFSMIVPLVIAKFFLSQQYASYILSRMIVFFFASLLISSTHTAFVVFSNQERADSGRINKTFSVEVTFLALSFCIFALVVFPFSKFITIFAKIGYVDLVFVSLAFLGISIKTFLGGLFLAMNERLRDAFVEFVFGLSNLILVVLFWFFFEINIRTVFLIYFISACLLFIMSMKMIDFKQLFPFRLEKEQVRGMFNFTKWIFMGTAAVYFVDWGDKFVLRYFVEFSDVGIYGFGFQIFKGLVVLFSVLGAYFLPFISANINNPEKIREYLYSKRPKIFSAAIVALICAYFMLPLGIKAIYGDTYQGSGKIFRILLPAVVFYLYTLFYVPIFNSLKRYKFVQLVNIIQVAANIPLNLILIPRYGMSGAAIATVTTYVIRAVIFEVYFLIKVKKLYR